MVTVDRLMLIDQPGLRVAIDRDLATRLDAAPTPPRWRRQDARWALRNVVRAARGQAPLALSYEVRTDVTMRDMIEADMVQIHAVRRRVEVIHSRGRDATGQPRMVLRADGSGRVAGTAAAGPGIGGLR